MTRKEHQLGDLGNVLLLIAACIVWLPCKLIGLVMYAIRGHK